MPGAKIKPAVASDNQAQGGVGYPRGDTRNLLRVALAMFRLEKPTLNNLAKATGHVKSGILRDIDRLQLQLGVMVETRGSEYHLTDWGPVLAGAAGIEQFLKAGADAKEEWNGR